MSTSRPNVLLLFSDQHRADVMGCEGHPDVETPNLDALAAQGVRFTCAYCQDGVCVPSRSSIFSGMYPRTLGCRDNDDRSDVMDEVVSLQAAMQANGYRTAAFGKRHLYQACDDGWDGPCGYAPCESSDNYFDWIVAQGYGPEFARDWAAEWGSSHPEGPVGAEAFTPAPLCAQVTQLPPDMTMEADSTRRTIDFMRECANNASPFFCWCSFYRPHQPYTPLQQYMDRFDTDHWGAGTREGDGLAKPPAFDQAPDALPPMLHARRLAKGIPWCHAPAHEDEAIFRHAIAAYYAGVLEIDDCVGRALAQLDRLGLRENTIVIYCADHGEFAGNHGLMEKVAQGHNVYEDTLRVPFIISWPAKLRRGETSSALVELVDMYPTLMELCGIERPASKHPLQGRSLAAHLSNGSAIGRSVAISENWSQVAIIGERFKLGHWHECAIDPNRDYRDFGDILFDRQNDPHELTNLAELPEHAQTLADLLSAYDAWATDIPITQRR